MMVPCLLGVVEWGGHEEWIGRPPTHPAPPASALHSSSPRRRRPPPAPRRLQPVPLHCTAVPPHRTAAVPLQTGYIDHDKLEDKALDYRPKLIIAGGSAYPREWDYARLRAIAGAGMCVCVWGGGGGGGGGGRRCVSAPCGVHRSSVQLRPPVTSLA